MSWIRDKLRKDIQDDLIELVEDETESAKEDSNYTSITTVLSEAPTSPDTVEVLQNKCSLPIAKKKIKLL
jgi:hypothetical protein